MKVDLGQVARHRPQLAAALRAIATVDSRDHATLTIAQWQAAATAHPDAAGRGGAGAASAGANANAFAGAELWAELHQRPFAPAAGVTIVSGATASTAATVASTATATTHDDPRDDSAWLEQFSTRIPCGACRQHWREILRATPPDFRTRDHYFAWTVAVHNQVNRHLAKPEMDLATATSKWQPPQPESENQSEAETANESECESAVEKEPSQWPLAVRIAVRIVARNRQPEDRGVGDTLARRLGGGGEAFQIWYGAVFRRDCGRSPQTWLNRHFPYPLPGE